MATSTDPLQRDRVLVQARDTGDRYQAPQTNSALQLAGALKQAQPVISETLDGIAQKDAEKARAQAHKDALMGQGQVLAEAVRAGKIKATQNPWYMEAYAKEGAAIRSQTAFTKLQTESTSWAEQTDPAAFAQKWREGVSEIAQGFTGKDEIAGFAPVEAQFTQQALQSNVSQNVTRIETERKQNNSALAADALVKLAAARGGVLTGQEAINAMEPARQLWMGTGGSETEWHDMAKGAVLTASQSSKNPGLLDLTKAIGLDGSVVLDGKFGSGADPHPVSLVNTPAPQLATAALPAAHAMPVSGGVTVKGGEYGAKRAGEPFHHGLDLAVPEGTKVVSPGVGTVIDVGHDSRSGNFVKIDHGDGLVSSYAHLSSADVKVGDRVAAGQAIALSGNTGASTGPHVHWRTRVNGVDVNPHSVAFPQGQAPAQSAVAQVAAGINAPSADAPPSPPVIARGPSLYDVGGFAQEIEQTRHFVEQAQEYGITEKVRVAKAQQAAAGMEATDYLYSVHGNDIVLGKYDTATLVRELQSKGYPPQVITAAMSNLHEATTDSAGLMANKMRINGSDPHAAKQVMDLALEGERDGYSPGYEQRVGQRVLSGDISGDDGTRMVSNSLARTRQEQAEARADAAAKRAEARDGPGIHNYAQARQEAENITGYAAAIHFVRSKQQWSPGDRAKAKRQIADAMGAWLTANPGDFKGAGQAGRDAAAAFLTAPKPFSLASPAAPSSANPRGN